MPKTTVSLDKETTAAIFKSIIEAVTVPVAKLTPRNSSPLAATTTTNQGSTAAPKIRETEGSTVTSTPATEFRPASEVQPPMNTTVSVQTAVAGAVGSHVASTPRTTASLDKEVLAVTSETTTKARQVPNNQVFYHSKALEKGTPKRHDSPLAAKSEDTATSTPLQASACPASVSIDMPRHDKEIAEDETTQNERAKLARWALELQHYNFELEHCPGRDNELPDFLSRNPSGPPISIDEDIERLTPPDRMRPAPLAR
ncbi:hypothetical protein TcasGA2_TC031943 [Tribolium castaneum]|uniref:Reverse transcriptase RNase H-like domain-containing protein n=1 Tax=Tribolium castaneum TaxID=7070 RepID=A0A139W8D9_TRICA|nr:hypothetical protein TcasGA2_TC031943 [Tribolium castaneum]